MSIESLGNTPLATASQRGYEQIANILMKTGKCNTSVVYNGKSNLGTNVISDREQDNYGFLVKHST